METDVLVEINGIADHETVFEGQVRLCELAVLLQMVRYMTQNHFHYGIISHIYAYTTLTIPYLHWLSIFRSIHQVHISTVSLKALNAFLDVLQDRTDRPLFFQVSGKFMQSVSPC